MSREIKFRAWDNVEQRFCTGAELSDRLVRTYVEDGESRELLLRSYIFGSDQDLVLMQYTGLKDKTGKDIYEGDIVREADEYYGEEGVYEVGFEAGGFWLLERDNENGWPFDMKTMEVIGNIYEHPELVQGKQATKGEEK